MAGISAVNFFEEPGHVLTEGAHDLDAFSVVFYFPGISAKPHIPIVGTRDNHLVEEKKIVHRAKDMGGTGATNGDDCCSNLACEQTSIGPGYD